MLEAGLLQHKRLLTRLSIQMRDHSLCDRMRTGTLSARLYCGKTSYCNASEATHFSLTSNTTCFGFPSFTYNLEGHDVHGGLVVIVLAIRPEACGFKLGRGRWLFKGDKNPQ
jgi:hypothetical protein